MLGEETDFWPVIISSEELPKDMCCATLINDWSPTRSIIPNNIPQSLTEFGPYIAQFSNLACQLSACFAALPSERAWWRGIVAVVVMSAPPPNS